MSSTRTFDTVFSGLPAMAQLFVSLLMRIRHGHVLLIGPNGEQKISGDPHNQPGARLVVHDWRACGLILRSGDIGFAEAFRNGWVSTPDLAQLLRLAMRNEDALGQTVNGSALMRFWYGLLHRLRPNTRRGSRRSIHAHYDIGNAFYELWLDRTWSYSAALFNGDYTLDLEQAQYQKYQNMVDALELKPGMKVLEIGCGWGGFALHAARQGIQVDGITISDAQAQVARQRIQAEGLTQSATIRLCDYRDTQGQYDAVVSVEMFEAVGQRFWPVYFETVHQRLKPGGKAMIQSITIEESRFDSYRNSSDFIRQFIFPGGMLPTPDRFIEQAGKAGLNARVCVAFGRDYAETLRRWARAFEQQHEQVKQQGFDDVFMRTWALYLAYCEAGFDEGRTNVIQFLLEK
jgi:cyclopropane-fatty-acyl-phospholipid synthase